MRFGVVLLFSTVLAWKEWSWGNKTFQPGGRRGHSMVLFKNHIVVFGGRTDDTDVPHVPKTYEIEQINGKLEFKSYNEKPVVPECNQTYIDQKIPCRSEEQSTTKVGVYYNDVWGYNINCTRYADDGCIDGKWIQFEKGSVGGGCQISLGAEICTHPTERWFHGAEVFESDTMIIYGGFSQRCEDYCDDMWSFGFEDRTWTELAEIGNDFYGPGKRWKFSSSSDRVNMYVFGGFRLWHGFSPLNSDENDWQDMSIYLKGGYMDDLWVFNDANKSWIELQRKEGCVPKETIIWEERNDVTCHTDWPAARAGHASVLFKDSLYIHGGYRTFFPYPSNRGPGAGRGVIARGTDGFSPFPTHPYYLDDMWQYNITTGYWKLIKPLGGIKPQPRTEHVMVVAGNIFVLFGGYKSNYYYDDTWKYNTSANQWLEQTTFVHPLYPENCTDDLEHRRGPHSGKYYPWLVPENVTKEDGLHFIPERHYGTQEFSVLAEPTRSIQYEDVEAIFIRQSRRQAPGWDGCRDRHDGRVDLPRALQYVHPSQRSAHRAVYDEQFQVVLVYGGYGFLNEEPYRSDITKQAVTKGDLWQYNLEICTKNCSMHGECRYGNCFCHEGYYGMDCSNSTCPGSRCKFDEVTKLQTCNHCCFAGYEHTSDDSYVPNVQKIPCSDENPGTINGVCDGFGKCICQPPYVGDDCSIRDCKHNCSGHGYCSIEFPNSRCMCDLGWIGQYCDQRVCLNNCSYPNGVCLNGSCWCDMRYEPYNAFNAYYPFMGEDCSFVVPFAKANKNDGSFLFAIFYTLLLPFMPF